MMKRIPEPELMNDAEQAAAYAAANFEEPHSRVIELFRETFPDWSGKGYVLDLGCGPGDISVRFAKAYPRCEIDGVDGSAAMLDADRARIERDPDLCRRIRLCQALLPRDPAPREYYDAVISNSLLHHLHDPAVLWHAVNSYAAPGAPVFIMDLMRPDSRADAEALTARYADGEPDVLRHDFFHSLLAAFTVDEVRDQLADASLGHFTVRPVSDRHLIVSGCIKERNI